MANTVVALWKLAISNNKKTNSTAYISTPGLEYCSVVVQEVEVFEITEYKVKKARYLFTTTWTTSRAGFSKYC